MSGARLQGIWNSAYVQRVGLIDHCNHFIALDTERTHAKIADDTEFLQRIDASIEREMMDIYLILDKWAFSRGSLKASRLARFAKNLREEGV